MPRRKRKYPGEIVPFGRPPVDPMEKVGRPIRCLVTPPVEQRLKEVAEKLGLPVSDVFRWALHDFLKAKGLLTGLENDKTWEETFIKIERSDRF